MCEKETVKIDTFVCFFPFSCVCKGTATLTLELPGELIILRVVIAKLSIIGLHTEESQIKALIINLT